MPEKPPDIKTKKTPRKKAISETDAELWGVFSNDIVPLKGRKTVHRPDSKLYELDLTEISRKRRVKFTRIEHEHHLSPDSSPSLARPAQIDKRTKAKFERGDMDIDGTIDLHGMTEHKAHSALSRFLGRHIEAGSRCLLVITGQGRNTSTGAAEGVLNKNLPLWVMAPRFAPFVLSATHAQRKHGGKGAYYILLRRKRAGD
ncbi:MAG TPA: Smr/MutS family protein [Alphaproteobacteria bacterium]|nr:Smr/MutS family protein [Alphaproteobacteria bacterium]HNS43786.1 Smr/MutS family protein [Alphaproteobacteria bacterium]